MFHLNANFLSDSVGKVAQSLVIRFMHIREARSGREILTMQWVLWEEIDVVVNNHQVAYVKLRIHAARSIADEEGFDAQFIHDALWECYLFHAVTLIEVETAFHSHDVFAAQFSEDEFSCMSFYG